MFWSVMVPTYNPEPRHLKQTLQSVLAQDPGIATMQIEVVDDCSSRVDVEQVVRELAGDRVAFTRNKSNKGLAGCWNECTERAHGEWVHILHQDDYLLPDFYQQISGLAQSHSDIGLIATRSFFVDEEGVISGVTPRIRSLEAGGHTLDELFYDNPLQCPGVVVSRETYRKFGGFRPDLSYTLDWEMWTRLVDQAGGIVSPSILACYRMTTQNASHDLARTGETLKDRTKLNKIFAQRYKRFNLQIANDRLCNLALHNARAYGLADDKDAARAHMEYWKRSAPLTSKAKYYGAGLYRRLRSVFSSS